MNETMICFSREALEKVGDVLFKAEIIFFVIVLSVGILAWLLLRKEKKK